jgi:hypothetical protein
LDVETSGPPSSPHPSVLRFPASCHASSAENLSFFSFDHGSYSHSQQPESRGLDLVRGNFDNVLHEYLFCSCAPPNPIGIASRDPPLTTKNLKNLLLDDVLAWTVYLTSTTFNISLSKRHSLPASINSTCAGRFYSSRYNHHQVDSRGQLVSVHIGNFQPRLRPPLASISGSLERCS